MQNFSKDIKEIISSVLKSESEILAAWFGGSTATGFEDALSDTDVVTICRQPELVFSLLEKVFSEKFEITHIWEVEDSPWKNFSQKFYIFNGGPATYYVDAGVFQSTDEYDYREYFNVERHGSPQIIFDREDILKKAALSPRAEVPTTLNEKNWCARFEILYRTFSKEALRGKYIDSFVFYQRLVALWVQLLRREHSPQKHDFGLRYIYRDLPEAEAQCIEKYLRVHDINDMKNFAVEIRQRILEKRMSS
ncbi:hypothetical protein QJS83_02890 [Bdellovibrio sp. 22V]|uniref:hypothetical protein n=1 Tax=Bdellovibrio sp. 22V TaxID=3044166 RepID=UPI0025435B40|nr:hypothetical protein [Bdellovibrio sp. 22V]WII72814.1 hypothetical protein QJS83_02890 [Bdellovibrio sp. 22V]